MTYLKLTADIEQARQIAKELHDLLHHDAVHRLKLYQDYAHDHSKWTPNLYLRCQLVDSLCKKLDSLCLNPSKPHGENKPEVHRLRSLG